MLTDLQHLPDVKRLLRIPLHCIALLFTILLPVSCSLQSIAGNDGTSTEVVGRITVPDGSGASHLPVSLWMYQPKLQRFSDTITDTTDGSGNFTFSSLDTGSYLLVARDDQMRSVMKEVSIDGNGAHIGLGEVIIDKEGTIHGVILDTVSVVTTATTQIVVCKGVFPIRRFDTYNARFTIDSLSPGNFSIRMTGEIIRKDVTYRTTQMYSLFDSTVSVLPGTALELDTINVNDAALAAAQRYNDPRILDEIARMRDFLECTEGTRDIPAGWLHPVTRHIRVADIEARNDFPLDSALKICTTFPDIEEIRLSGFKGAVFSDTVFTLNNLTLLSCINGELDSFAPARPLPGDLSEIRLDGNRFTAIPRYFFDEPSGSLSKVTLTGNPFTGVPWEDQQQINSLSTKGVSVFLADSVCTVNSGDYLALLSFFEYNGIGDRPVQPCIHAILEGNDKGTVTSLRITDAVIKGFPDDFSNLTGLQHILLSRNALDTLPKVLGMLTRLQDLHITNGTLSILPPYLSNCTDLRTLDFSNNHITILPKWLGTLRSLDYSDFSFNCIDPAVVGIPDNCIISQPYCATDTPAPDSLFAADTAAAGRIIRYGRTGPSPLTADYYQCRGNRIEFMRLVIDTDSRKKSLDTLFSMLSELDSLKTVHLVFRSQVDTFPELPVVLPGIRELLCTGGGLSALAASFATAFPGLTTLSLPGNAFTSVPEVLHTMPDLTGIDLYFNLLGDLPSEEKSWLDERSLADHRVLWDSNFGFSYIKGLLWNESQRIGP